jgi:hypothetical protein
MRPAYRRRLAQVPIQVPLWMAVALATRAKCVIQPPQWMEPPALEEVLRKERESEAEFQARTRPPHARCITAAVSASLCAARCCASPAAAWLRDGACQRGALELCAAC